MALTSTSAFPDSVDMWICDVLFSFLHASRQLCEQTVFKLWLQRLKKPCFPLILNRSHIKPLHFGALLLLQTILIIL